MELMQETDNRTEMMPPHRLTDRAAQHPRSKIHFKKDADACQNFELVLAERQGEGITLLLWCLYSVCGIPDNEENCCANPALGATFPQLDRVQDRQLARRKTLSLSNFIKQFSFQNFGRVPC